jgi:hypothetical protein
MKRAVLYLRVSTIWLGPYFPNAASKRCARRTAAFANCWRTIVARDRATRDDALVRASGLNECAGLLALLFPGRGHLAFELDSRFKKIESGAAVSLDFLQSAPHRLP